MALRNEYRQRLIDYLSEFGIDGYEVYEDAGADGYEMISRDSWYERGPTIPWPAGFDYKKLRELHTLANAEDARYRRTMSGHQ